MRLSCCALVSATVLLSLAISTSSTRSARAADDKPSTPTKLPLLLDENFASGADKWKPASSEGWKLIDIDGGKAFSEFKNTDITKNLPYRSPWNIAMLKDTNVGDFVMEVKMRETAKEYPHRDSCLVFGYQNPSHFYYTHFASTTKDGHANQIFMVNDADRAKITEADADPVKWGEKTDWHRLKIVRNVSDGLIAAYFDDMDKPIMTAHDKTFTWGRIGIGTFDDTRRFRGSEAMGRKGHAGSSECRLSRPGISEGKVKKLSAGGSQGALCEQKMFLAVAGCEHHRGLPF